MRIDWCRLDSGQSSCRRMRDVLRRSLLHRRAILTVASEIVRMITDIIELKMVI